eukprot:CAMPEP_0179098818 /NCGR_PEP_ID=MMETSP0796-20121207/45558_1 /TAXON_ID=73915 /ORGANISM="Pyrodinium bahamense, Strain pbaha01" /LENGTH=397 /DNA_ID=CAMNT_0020796605 /DNA_START=220 /DNA_END=1409 /DNA_ORIENTATION=-
MPLFDSIAAASIRNLPLLDSAAGPNTSMVLGLVSALALAGRFSGEVASVAAAALREHGEGLDREAAAASRDLGNAGPASGGPEEGPLAAKEVGGSVGGNVGAGGANGDQPCVVFERQDMCVLLKPPGWTVTVDSFVGEAEDDDGQALLGPQAWSAEGPPAERGQQPGGGKALQAWVAQTSGAAVPLASDPRAGHGLVHRLDRDTSGLLLCARSYRGLFAAQLELAARRIRKEYVCLCLGHFPEQLRLLEEPLMTGTGYGSTWRTSVSPSGRRSKTEVLAIARCRGPKGSDFSLVEVLLHTGRRHQIRVHLASAGHPLLGDVWYGESRSAVPWCPRLFLHAHRLCLNLGACGGGSLDVQSALPRDLRAALRRLSPVPGAAPREVQQLRSWQGWQQSPG